MGQSHVGDYRIPNNPRDMPGYQDREVAALKLAASLPEGESDAEEVEEEEDLLGVANGEKAKTTARNRSSIHPAVHNFLEKSSTNQETAEQLLIESMQSREEYQNQQLKLVEKKNRISEDRNKMLEKLLLTNHPNKEISIKEKGKEFGECVELASLEQVKQEVSEYLGVNVSDVSGLLRSFASHPSSNNANGQKVTRVNQLYHEDEIDVSSVDISGHLYILFRTN